MEWYEWLLGIAFTALWVVPLVYELFISSFIDWIKLNKSNKEWKKENPGKQRLRCIDCKYCKFYYHHPFSKYGQYRNTMVTKEPTYCRLLRRQISGRNSRCQIPDNNSAFWE